jgi:glycosyltransferase involved in cell wall biosynthesis
MSKNVLFIAAIFPEPNSSAAGKRILQLVHFFKKSNYTIQFASTSPKNNFSFDLSEINVKEININANDNSIDDYLIENVPDIVVFDRFYIEEQFSWKISELCPKALKILDTEDLHFLRKNREKTLKNKNNEDSSDLYRELASILRCDISFIISEFEFDLLNQNYSFCSPYIFYLPFLVEHDELLIDTPTFENRKDFLFIGNFFHEPNCDAVLILKNEIWPKIKGLNSSLRLFIYGAYMPSKIKQLHDQKFGFNVCDRGEDATKIFKNARVILAPLRFGAGLKGKLFDAMIHGLPSVTTSIGAEGLNGNLNWPGFIEDDFQTFATKAVELYEDVNLWQKSQKNGFEILKQRFLASQYEQSLLNSIILKMNNLHKFRTENVLGSMLNYHLLKSTKYLSKWIAEKKLNK